MKVGDLVELAARVTRRGRPEDDQVGLVIEIKSTVESAKDPIAIVDFGCIFRRYPVSYLRVVRESR